MHVFSPGRPEGRSALPPVARLRRSVCFPAGLPWCGWRSSCHRLCRAAYSWSWPSRRSIWPPYARNVTGSTKRASCPAGRSASSTERSASRLRPAATASAGSSSPPHTSVASRRPNGPVNTGSREPGPVPCAARHGGRTALVPASPEARAGPWWNGTERRGTLSVSETQL